MSTKDPIYCFNGKPTEDKGECIYAACGMYLEEVDLCKLEYLKGDPSPVAPKRTVTKPTNTVPIEEPETEVGGSRLISSLKEGDTGNKQNPINIKGTLVFDSIQKDVDTSRGPATVTSIVIKDESGEAKISFWGDSGNAIMDFVKGDKLFLEGLYKVKSPYDGKAQVDGGKYFKVAKIN